MSSYINHPFHFNSIKKSVRCGMVGFGNDMYNKAVHRLRYIENMPETSDNYKTVMVELIEELQNLQILCVNYQYSGFETNNAENDIKTAQQFAKDYTRGTILEGPAIYKGLNCILYQIEIDKLEHIRPLTHREKLAFDIADLIIQGIADWYMQSKIGYLPWGMEPTDEPDTILLMG